MSEYREVATPKPSDKGKGKIATIEIHPEGAGFNSVVSYEDGEEPDIRECKSRAVLIGYLMKVLPSDTASAVKK